MAISKVKKKEIVNNTNYLDLLRETQVKSKLLTAFSIFEEVRH